MSDSAEAQQPNPEEIEVIIFGTQEEVAAQKAAVGSTLGSEALAHLVSLVVH
jgi:hypothetical protein